MPHTYCIDSHRNPDTGTIRHRWTCACGALSGTWIPNPNNTYAGWQLHVEIATHYDELTADEDSETDMTAADAGVDWDHIEGILEDRSTGVI